MQPTRTYRTLFLVYVLCLASPPLPAAPLSPSRSSPCALCLRLRGGARQGVEVAVPRDVESLQTAVDGAGSSASWLGGMAGSFSRAAEIKCWVRF